MLNSHHMSVAHSSLSGKEREERRGEDEVRHLSREVGIH